jgi:hypothetical protein
VPAEIGCVMNSQISSRVTSSNEEYADAYDLLRALLADRGTDDCSVASEGTEQGLLRCREIKSGQLWSALADEAEYHGVAPLIEPMITALSRKKPEAVSDDVRRAFVTLASYHRRAAVAREKCVDQLLAAFAIVGIPIILLKGAALAHRIYPAPELRPMVDIDVLIDPADAEHAVAITRGLGYSFARRHASPFAGRMHHFPAATADQSGFRIALEIHMDAMSPNQGCSLTIATLTAKTQPFQRGYGPSGIALGHTDMLRHLARHAFEPARRIRLKHLYDIWRYHVIFRDEINWRELATRFPDVIVVLQLVSYVFARPGAAANNSTSEPVPAGVGLGMVPLSEIAAADVGLCAKFAALFNPPAWWLHGFYGVPPEKSLLTCRTIHHPITLARWLAKRFVAGFGLSASAPACIAGYQEACHSEPFRGQLMTGLQKTMIDHTPVPAADVEMDTVDGEVLLFHPQQARAVYLNQTAAAVWTLCNGSRSVREIIRVIGECYPDADAKLTDEVLVTLNQLQESGVLLVRERALIAGQSE